MLWICLIIIKPKTFLKNDEMTTTEHYFMNNSFCNDVLTYENKKFSDLEMEEASKDAYEMEFNHLHDSDNSKLNQLFDDADAWSNSSNFIGAKDFSDFAVQIDFNQMLDSDSESRHEVLDEQNQTLTREQI